MCALFLQALGDNLDFSTVETMSVIERFLKSCSDELSKYVFTFNVILYIWQQTMQYRATKRKHDNILLVKSVRNFLKRIWWIILLCMTRF